MRRVSCMGVRETLTVLYSVVGFVETPERLSLFVVYSTSTVVPVVDICTLFDFESTLTWKSGLYL